MTDDIWAFSGMVGIPSGVVPQASRGSVFLASASGKLGPSGAWQAVAGSVSQNASRWKQARQSVIMVQLDGSRRRRKSTGFLLRPGGIPRDGIRMDGMSEWFITTDSEGLKGIHRR